MLQGASRLLEEALKLEPDNASIYFELGFCHHGLEQFPKAINYYTAALKLGYLRKFVVLGNRAVCLLESDKIDEALQDANSSLQSSPHYPLALKTRACAFKQLQQPDRAYSDYTTIIENAQSVLDQAEAYFKRATVFGNLDEPDIDAALNLDPTNAEYMQHKAAILLNRQDTRGAIDLVSQWLADNETHVDSAQMYAFRGDLYDLIGDRDASERDYEMAAEIERSTAELDMDSSVP